MTREMLQARRANAKKALAGQKKQILICAGTGCIAGGSLKIYDYMKEECARRGLCVHVNLMEEEGECSCGDNSVSMKKSGCHGFCEMGPLMQIEPEGILYTHVKLEDCDEIIEKSILGDEVIERLLYTLDGVAYAKHDEIPFYHKQHRVVLANCGTTDAEDLNEYLARDGYVAFEKALFDMTDEEICKEIMDSGLRGRGGGGFPAGRKWDSVRKQPKGKKYVVCNGDEGDPGAFMDRSIMEGNPHSVIEGMLIAACAAGSDEGYIYVRAEYPLAVTRLKVAIAKAEQAGLLGDNILGSGFSFHLHVNRGAGAFVCGEGSALTASIEGNRGMPRVKPPRTVEHGLWAQPTVLNNVETFSAVPLIVRNGADWFKSIGTEGTPGTKAFALTGNVVNTGLIEVPMGTTLREVIFNIGGGIKDGKKFKAVQIGGPSGGCLTEEHLDMPMDFDSLKKVGAMIGSGGLVVMDEDTCMVEVARFFMNFTQNESCGKCVPCREGTRRMLEILERIVKNEGTLEDLDLLEELASTITETALCGLGQSACKPVISTLKHFRNEYLAHVVDKHCPHCNGAPKVLKIDPDKCKGCTKCKRNCPMDAITGEVKQVHVIDTEKCIKCGACIKGCPFGAIAEV
ncbi:MAG: 4Fe-4S binding protein [Oscillospiraceae bacterium]|nr:4Fe-4S binding protein [Oscillospiraceae bacterium]